MSIDSVFLIGPDNISDIVITDYESDHRAILSIFNTNF